VSKSEAGAGDSIASFSAFVFLPRLAIGKNY
jgi:hypothetical protein